MTPLLDHVQATVIHAAQNAKVASAVAVTTTSTGTATWLEYIPDDIGKLGTVIGMIVSLIVIYAWTIKIKTIKHDEKLKKIQVERDQLELDARKDELSKKK